MPCYRPLLAHRGLKTSENGKRPLSFNIHEAYQDLPVAVPCGKCIGCRKDKALQWASRCYHESKMHQHNYFVTLTYNDENIPEGGTLVKQHLQDFMRKLRINNPHEKIRFYAVGEYGSRLSRPHYHILLFGHHFDDLKLHRRSNKPGQQAYRSDGLERTWTRGNSEISDFNQKTALYVTKYTIKKITGVQAEGHYGGKLPEFALMSLKPGIGAEWLKKYKSDVYPKDFFTIQGVKYRPPRFYDNIYSTEKPKSFEAVKAKRAQNAKANDVGGVRRYYVADVKTAHEKHFNRRKFENEPR